MQSQIVAGETLNYRAVAASYPASAGWVVTLYLNPRAGGTATSVASTADGDDHLLQVAAATTAGWAPGWWAWETWAALGGERYRLEAGQLQVVAGLIGAAAGTDTRSDAEKALAAVTAMLAGKAGSGVESYRINGRELRSYPLPDLLRLQQQLRRDVQAEQTAANIAAGLGGRQRFVVRM